MILSGPEIEKQLQDGVITISPFNPEHVNPNSVDLTLGDTILQYTNAVIDPRVEQDVVESVIPETGRVLEPMSFCLGASREVVGSTGFAPMVHAKSSTARAGLFVHVTADLIDIGSLGVVTFQLFSVLPLRVFPGMRIAQMTFWKPRGEIQLYEGKYQGSTGPMKSMIYRDEFWKSGASAEAIVP